MGWYVPRAVDVDLSTNLVTAWQARIRGEHRIVPDGTVDVLWIGNGTAWVCGPETTAWTFRLPPGMEAVGVRFRPGRAGAVLGFDARQLLDQRAPVTDLLGSRAGRHLLEQLGEAPDSASRLRLLQGNVRGWVRRAPTVDPVVEMVYRMLADDPGTSVAALAAATGRTERALHRRCVRAFGYGPARLRRILRMQRFRALAGQRGRSGWSAPSEWPDVRSTPSGGLAALAALAGYTDQPHLSRDCRQIAGLSPAAMLADGDRLVQATGAAGTGE